MVLNIPLLSFPGVRQSKFRHLKGTPAHKSEYFENLRNVDQRLPGESNMFHANSKFCAIPLSGPGGSVAVLNVSAQFGYHIL